MQAPTANVRSRACSARFYERCAQPAHRCARAKEHWQLARAHHSAVRRPCVPFLKRKSAKEHWQSCCAGIATLTVIPGDVLARSLRGALAGLQETTVIISQHRDSSWCQHMCRTADHGVRPVSTHAGPFCRAKIALKKQELLPNAAVLASQCCCGPSTA
jgi:hypothetical protein